MINTKYEPLVDLLRNEIEAYGRLFHLLEMQRAALIQQDIDAIISHNQEVENQTAHIKRLNRDRLKMVSELHPDGVSRIISLVDRIEDNSKELLQELIREINRLIRESHRQLSCNQMLYRRALEISRETLRVLRPDRSEVPGIYRRDGITNSQRKNGTAACIARLA